MPSNEIEVLTGIINNELGKLKSGDKVRTIEFVNKVIKEFSGGNKLSEEDETRLRPMVVDVLWELQRKGIIKFSDDLLIFEKSKA